MLNFRAQDMPEEDMHFLNPGGFSRRYDNQRIGYSAQFSAVVSGKGGSRQPHGPGHLQCAGDIGAVAGRGESDGDVAGAAKGFDLAREDPVKAEIVTAGG